MKKLLFILPLFLFACKKDHIVETHQIQYFVTTANPGDYMTVWFADETEVVASHPAYSPWGYGFATTKNPFTAVLAAIVNNSPGESLTLTLKVDGKIVKQETAKDSTQGALYTDMQFMYYR